MRHLGGGKSKADHSPASSTATTIPGSDGEAKRMAAENNAIRLAEIQQYQQSKNKPPLGSQSSELSGSPPDHPSKLRRVGSSPIFPSNSDASSKGKPVVDQKKKKMTSKTCKQQKKGRVKKANKKKGKKGSKNKMQVKQAQVSNTATEKQGEDKKQKQQQEQQPQVTQPQAAPKQLQQQVAQQQHPPVQQPKAPEVKQEPHEATGSKEPNVPVATPARSNLPPPPVASKLVKDMLNRTTTQEQLHQAPQTPGKSDPAHPPQSKPPVEAEPGKAKKGRDPVRHARKQKFYRSLESRTLNKRHTTSLLFQWYLLCLTLQLCRPAILVQYVCSMFCLQSTCGPKQLQRWKLHSIFSFSCQRAYGTYTDRHPCWPTQARIHLKLWRNLPDVHVKDRHYANNIHTQLLSMNLIFFEISNYAIIGTTHTHTHTAHPLVLLYVLHLFTYY